MGDEEKKVPYNHRLLAAVDSSIAAGRDFVVGRGWSPLVHVGLSPFCVFDFQLARVLLRSCRAFR